MARVVDTEAEATFEVHYERTSLRETLGEVGRVDCAVQMSRALFASVSDDRAGAAGGEEPRADVRSLWTGRRGPVAGGPGQAVGLPRVATAACAGSGGSAHGALARCLDPRPYLTLRKEAAAEDGPEFLEVTRMATEAERKDGGGDEAGRGSGGGPSKLFW